MECMRALSPNRFGDAAMKSPGAGPKCANQANQLKLSSKKCVIYLIGKR